MNVSLIIIVLVALFFDFTNGFHDTANAIATIVSTKAVSPRQAVVGAALFNFLGAFVSLKVATTVAKGIVDPRAVTLQVILAGLIGAIIWNLLTWRMGLPSSSSHALIGGVAGATAMAAGWHVIKWHGLQEKVLLPSLLSPFLGLALAGVIISIILYTTRKYARQKVNRTFKHLQLLSGGFVAFTHGTNDAQKTMGIIGLALIANATNKSFHIPLWVVAASASAMAAGTYVGGWRIINTLGERITKLEPPQGFAAEAATAVTIGLTSHLGFPVSTTHTISGSILGAGAATRPHVVNWKVVKHILLAWFITIPFAAAVGAIMEVLTHSSGGAEIAFIVLVVIAFGIYLTRNWTWESRAQIKNLLGVIRARSNGLRKRSDS